MSETPLHFKTVTEAAELIESKQLSPVELTTALLARVDELDGRLRSYATVMADHAMASARRAEEEILAGAYRGPLHGIPVAVKDLCFTKGVRTMGGTPVLASHVPDFDGTAVERLEAAGAVLLGKLNLTEGAMRAYHPDLDAPVNPWNSERWAGVSSSGSGVATAAGLCLGSLGSDTGGSIRYPSACCGIVGLKPTWGRVSRHGVLPLADSMDHLGPMTRSAADAGIMLQVIAGADAHDPTSLPEEVPDMLAGIEKGVRGVRLGFDEEYATRDVHPELAAAVKAGVQVLENLGAEVIEVRLPDVDPYVAVWPTICTVEAVVAHEATYPSRRDEYGPWFQGWLDKGANITGAEYVRAGNLRAALNGHLRRVFQEIDVLACPSTIEPAHPITPETLIEPETNRHPKYQRYTAPYDYNGAPTLSVPCGMSSGGLPLSLQFVGKHLSEPLLCRVGHAYESATEWHRLRPDV